MKKLKAKVYIDGANMFYTQRLIGSLIDWKKTKKLLNNKFEVLELRYYTGIKENDEKMKKYLSYLRDIQIKTITKPLKIIKNKENQIIHKSNCDVEMVVDIMADLNNFDLLVLFSGDSDFAYLVKILNKQYQKLIYVFSSRKTISWEIKLAVNKYWFIEDTKEILKKPPPKRGTVKQ